MAGGRGRRGSRGRKYSVLFKEMKEKKENDEKVKASSSQESESEGEEGEQGTGEQESRTSDADEEFDRLLLKASPCDVYYEYLHFRKLMPPLLPKVHGQLLEMVQNHLKISEVKMKLVGGNETVNFTSSSLDEANHTYPLLDALSLKLGYSLRYLVAPPTTKCLLCNEELTLYNQPTTVVIHTLQGPQIGTKYSWQCRRCDGMWRFSVNQGAKNRVFYSPDLYGNPQVSLLDASFFTILPIILPTGWIQEIPCPLQS